MLREILTARTRPSDKMLYNIWARKLTGGWAKTTITSTLPLAFLSKTAQTLTDYRIYGTAEGAGVQTESGEPTGYKIPMTVTSRVYNLVDIESISLLSNDRYGIAIDAPGTYTITAFANSSTYIYCRSYDANNDPISDNLSVVSSSGTITTRTLTINQGEKIYVFDPITTATPASAKAKFTNDYVVAVSGPTAPDHYIPHRYTTDYNLYIGSTKLGAEEYVDYSEQKIYKDVSGTLTPTDPPLPFPAISAYQGENTLSSTETVGSVSLTGKIKEVT